MRTVATRYRWLWLCLCLLTSWPSLAQTGSFTCGTDEYTAQRLATDTTYRRFYQNLKPNQNKGGVDTTTVYTIPVVFVVYHLGEPVGTGSNLADVDLQAQIDQMNRMFAGQRPDYLGPDTKIRFALAQRTPSCTAFNGIARVDARSVPSYEATGLGWLDSQMADRLRKLLPDYSAWTSDRFVIVRVAHRVYGAGGWAELGGNIFVSAGAMQNTSIYNNLLTHEMGHSLFLLHTFWGSESGGNNFVCPSNNSPDYEGDYVADTDPHKKWEPGNACDPASENAINSCTGQPFGLIGRNHMSYGCNTILFTRGQMIRMRSYFTENSKGLLNSPYLYPPETNESVKAACVPSFVQATGSTDEGVHAFYFQQIARQTRSSQNYITGHYKDYSCSERATVTAGQSYSLTLSGHGRFRRVYIDYNNDGLFDEGTERVLNDEVFTTDEQLSSGLITIPTNAVPGLYLRMRVVVNGGNVAPTACDLPGAPYSGEAEDYSLRILSADTPASLSIGTLASAFACRDQQLNVPIITEGTFAAGNLFTVQLSDATGSFQNPMGIGSSSGSPVSVRLPLSIPLGSDYRMRVVSSNPDLTSLPGPALTLDDLPTATISGSQTLLAGQTATLTVALTGRPTWFSRINRSGQTLFQYYGTSTSPISLTFIPQDSDVYTMGYVRNVCGYGIVSGSAAISVPCSIPTSLSETQTGVSTAQLSWPTSPNVVFSLEWKEITATNWNLYEYVYPSPYIRPYVAQHTLNGLEPGKTYQWRVRKWCLDGVSDWSPIRAFTMQCLSPTGPTEQFTETSATLSWQNGPNTLSYQVRWRDAGSAAWNEVHTLSANQLALSSLTAGAVYEWQVRRFCSNEVQSAFTSLRWFSTQCAVPQPGSSSNVTGSSVRVSWTGGQSGLRYGVRWRAVGASNWSVSDSLTTATNLVISGLSTYTNYEWQVRSFCTTNQSSDYSATGSFNTNCQPPLSSYVTNIQPTSVQVNWGGMTVNLRWRAVGTATWNVVSGLSGSFYSLTGLTTGTTYEAQLQTGCSGGATSVFSNPLSFTPQCPVPNFMSELNVTASLAVVQWGVSLTSVSASVQWRPVGTTTWQSSTTLTPTNGVSYSYTLTGLTAGQPYEWRVVTYCPGGSSTSSASRTFVAQCATPTPSYSYNDGEAVVVLYGSIQYAVYQVRWRLQGGSTWTESTTIASTAYRITGLTIGQPYEWQVRAICTDGAVSDYSTSLTMVAVCPVPTGLYTYTIRPTSAQLSWNNAGVTSELRYRPVNVSDWTYVSIMPSPFSLTGLTNGVQYEWQVRSVCSGTTLSGFSNSNFFTTTCRQAQYLYETYVLATSAKVGWSSETDMRYILQWRQQGTATWQESGTLATGSPNPITGLTTGVVYEWRVLTDCDGVLTPTDSRTFLTQCVQLSSGSLNYHNVSSRAATLNWSGATGLPGLAYRVRWRPVGTTTWTESATLTGNSYAATGLTNDTVYEWQVQSICDGVGVSYVGASSSFTTACVATTAYAPQPGDTWVQLNWSTIPNEWYDLEYRLTNSPTWTVISSLTTGTYQLTTTPGAAYEYRIRTACSDGSTGTLSNVVSFTTLPACDPLEPNDSFTVATPITGTSFTSVALCMNRPFDQDWFRWQHNGHDYYVVVRSNAGNLLGGYRLSLDVNGTTLTIRALNGEGAVPYISLFLLAADGVTPVAAGGGVYANGIIQQLTYNLPAPCAMMITVKNGNWTDPTVWSCGRLPVASDAVQVLHAVTVPSPTAGRANRISYGSGGRLLIQNGAKINLGQ